MENSGHTFDPGGGGQIADIGSGTGVFSGSLAEWFQANVMAVEPNAAMRKVAEATRPNARVQFVNGDASRIPARDHSFKIAWLSTVIHHIPSLSDAGHELSRVLNARGRVLVRSAFPERSAGIHLFQFFPEASQQLQTFPTIESLANEWASHFALAHVEDVPQVTAQSLVEFRSRFSGDRRKSDTTLSVLTEGQYKRGIERIDSEIVKREDLSEKVVDFITLAVFERK